MAEAELKGRDLTADELKVYDRQVRVWGLEKQKRMLRSKILFFSLDGTNSEVLKNCVLAGVGGCTIVEDSIVTQENVESHFYLTPSDIGKQWSKVAFTYFHAMNPNVELQIRTRADILSNDNALNGYTIVSMSNQDLKFQKQVAAKCRELGIAYFYSRSCGLYATAFCDCIEFKWTKKVMREKEQPKVMDVDAMDVDQPQEKTETQLMNYKNAYPTFDAVCSCKLKRIRRRTKLSPVLLIIVQAFEQALSEEKPLTKENIIENIQSNCQERGVDSAEVLDMKIIDTLLTTFDCNIGMVNAWLAGYISNSVITCIQRDEKHPPFFNFLALDAFGSVIMHHKFADCRQIVLSES